MLSKRLFYAEGVQSFERYPQFIVNKVESVIQLVHWRVQGHRGNVPPFVTVQIYTKFFLCPSFLQCASILQCDPPLKSLWCFLERLLSESGDTKCCLYNNTTPAWPYSRPNQGPICRGPFRVAIRSPCQLS